MQEKLDCAYRVQGPGVVKSISDQIQKNWWTCHIAKVISKWEDFRPSKI